MAAWTFVVEYAVNFVAFVDHNDTKVISIKRLECDNSRIECEKQQITLIADIQWIKKIDVWYAIKIVKLLLALLLTLV